MDLQSLKTLWSATIAEGEFETGDPELTRRDDSALEATFSASATLNEAPATYSAGATHDSAVDVPGPSPSPSSSPPRPAPSATGLATGFEDLGEVARGGMGVVVRARQRSLHREIAIKRSLSASPSARAAFISEALTTAFLDHPNIVPVHELERSDDDRLSLAMKLVGGTEWKMLLRAEEKPSLGENLSTLLKVCDAVAFAHSRGIVHCDLKPENVMVGAFNEVLVMDWGVAVDIRGGESGIPRARPRESLRGPFGTPSYMAPEMARGEGAAIDERTDVYLLGAILCELLTGRPPHRGPTLLKTLVKASSGEPPVLPDEVPEELAQICRSAMAGAKDGRFASVKDFQSALTAFLSHRESLAISGDAEATLAECRRTLDAGGGLSDRRRIALYARFAEAVAGFRQARALWAENPRALAGERSARIEYAEAALAGDDLGLAEAQADSLAKKGAVKQRLLAQIKARKGEKARAARNARVMKGSVIGLVATVVLGLSGGLYLINEKQKETVAAKSLAESEREEAKAARALAEDEREKAKAAEAKEREERGKAEKRLEVLKATFNTMINNMSGAMRYAPNAETQKAHKRILFEMLTNVEALRAEADSDDQALALFNTTALLELGEVCIRLGQYDRSESFLGQAAALIASRLKAEPAGREPRRDQGLLLMKRRELAQKRGRDREALALSTRAAAVYRALMTEDPADLKVQESLTWALVLQANDKKRTGDIPGAIALYGETLNLSRAVISREAKSADALRSLAMTAYETGGMFMAQKKPDKARAFWTESTIASRALIKVEGTNSPGQRLLIMALGALGDLAFAGGELDAAYEFFLEAKERSDRLAAMDFSNNDLRKNMIKALEIMGRDFKARGRSDLALGAYRANLDVNRSLLALDPKNPALLTKVRLNLDQIGELHRGKSRFEDALAAFKESLAILEKTVAVDPDNRLHPDRFRLTYRRLGMTYDSLAMSIQAGECFEKAIAACRTMLARDKASKRYRRGLALALVRDGSFRLRQRELERARASLSEAEALSAALTAEDPAAISHLLDHAYALRRLGELAQAQESYPEARAAFLKCLEQRRRLAKLQPKSGGARRNVSFAQEALAKLAALQGQHKEAAERYRESLIEEQAAASLSKRYLKTEARLKRLADEAEARAKSEAP